MITFKTIELRNYKSFKQVNFNYLDRGLTLVEGENHDSTAFNSNGSAKSALLSGMTYALFGKTGQDNEKSDDIINRDEGKDTSAILEYEVGGNKYRVERYRKHTKHKNKVLFFLNDTEITEKSAKDTNESIEESIGMDYNIYTNTIMYGQGGDKTFVQATDKEKKDILSDIARISIYTEAQELVKEQRKEIVDTLSENEREQENKQRDIEHTQSVAQQEVEDYRHTENEIERVKKDTLALETEYLDLDIGKRLNDAREHYNTLIENPVEHTYPDQEKLGELDDALVKVKEKKQELSLKVRYLRQEMGRLIDKQNELDLSDNCPTCGQEMDTEHVEQEYNKLSEESGKLNDQITAIEKAIETKLVTAIDKLERAKVQEQERMDEEEEQMNVDFDTYQKNVAEYSQTVNSLENTEREHRSKIQGYKSTLESLERVPKPRDYSKKLEELNQELEDLKESNRQLFRTQEAHNRAIDALSREGVQSAVLDNVVPFLNEHANKYLNYLSGGTIRVNFTTQVETQAGDLRDKFDVEVVNEVGADKYSGLSSGEKRRVDLAVSLAIQDLVFDSARVRTNVVFYDEIFENLDSVASERVVEILDEMSKKVESVFVITHNPDLKPLFSNTVKVEKRNGESKIVSE